MALFDTVPSGVSGAADNMFQSSPDNWWQGAGADASVWSKLLGSLQSKEGQKALGGVGQSLLSAGAGTDDSRYLRTNALAPAWSPGTTNSLLNTLLQMRLQEQQQQAATLQNFRPSLLG